MSVVWHDKNQIQISNMYSLIYIYLGVCYWFKYQMKKNGSVEELEGDGQVDMGVCGQVGDGQIDMELICRQVEVGQADVRLVDDLEGDGQSDMGLAGGQA